MTTTELRQQLAIAEAADAAQKRAAAAAQVKQLTAEGARVTAELEPLIEQIRAAQNDRLRINGLLLQARNQISAFAAPLDPLTFPSENQEKERLRQLAAWKAQQLALLKKHEDCVRRENVRPQAVALQRRLQTLEFQIKNLSVLAEGGKIGEVTGAVSQGVENFLEGSQVGPPR